MQGNMRISTALVLIFVCYILIVEVEARKPGRGYGNFRKQYKPRGNARGYGSNRQQGNRQKPDKPRGSITSFVPNNRQNKLTNSQTIKIFQQKKTFGRKDTLKLFVSLGKEKRTKKASKKVCISKVTKYERKLVERLFKLRKKNRSLQCSIKDRPRRDISSKFPEGTTVLDLGCVNSKTFNKDTKSLNMCDECTYTVTLPATYFPRDHRHVECGESPQQETCFSNEGVCVQNVVTIHVLHDKDAQLGEERMLDWATVPLSITKSCSCEILEGSVFQDFL